MLTDGHRFGPAQHERRKEQGENQHYPSYGLYMSKWVKSYPLFIPGRRITAPEGHVCMEKLVNR